MTTEMNKRATPDEVLDQIRAMSLADREYVEAELLREAFEAVAGESPMLFAKRSCVARSTRLRTRATATRSERRSQGRAPRSQRCATGRAKVDAAAWYEDQREGLGAEFMDEVDRVLRLVESTAAFRTAPVEHLDDGAVVRRELVRRFPYVVVFVESETLRKVILIRRADGDPQRWWARAQRR